MEDDKHYRDSTYQARPFEWKRGPKQIWVAKDGADRQHDHDTFIGDKRQKTASVFERISPKNDKAADPAESRGRRDQ